MAERRWGRRLAWMVRGDDRGEAALPVAAEAGVRFGRVSVA